MCETGVNNIIFRIGNLIILHHIFRMNRNGIRLIDKVRQQEKMKIEKTNKIMEFCQGVPPGPQYLGSVPNPLI